MGTENSKFEKQQIAQEGIKDFLRSEGVGSLRFRAFCDYLRISRYSYRVHSQIIQRNPESTFGNVERAVFESSLRTDEHMLANALFRVDLSSEEIPEYDNFYQEVRRKSLDLEDTIRDSLLNDPNITITPKRVEILVQQELLRQLEDLRSGLITRS